MEGHYYITPSSRPNEVLLEILWSRKFGHEYGIRWLLIARPQNRICRLPDRHHCSKPVLLRSILDLAQKTMAEFMNGAIRKVILHNFVTYSDVEFVPGPGLNLIVGPNGSGKSSIVCALCLGLGGSTSSLGRADKIGEFIKRGCQSGYTEIHLQNNSEPTKMTIIRRVFTGNKSKYIVNNRTSTEKQIHRITESLNIQVDNLCQFLAQERVGEFAKLEPRGLLKDTEKAADRGQLYEQHMKLIELRKQEKEARLEMEASQNELERKKMQLNTLAVEVERIRQRSTLQDRLKLLKKKVPWIEFENLKEYARVLNQEKQAADANLERIKKQQEPLRNIIASVRESSQARKDDFIRLQNLCKQLEQKYNSLKDQCQQYEVDVQVFGDELVQVEKRAQALQHEISSKNEQISNLQQKLESLPDPEIILQELRDIHAKKEELKNARASLMAELRDFDDRIAGVQREKSRFSEQLKKFESERERRSASLFKAFGNSGQEQNCKRFMNWLDKHGRAQCKGNVYGPVGLEVNCAIPGAEKYIEYAISWRNMFTFVVENDDDLNILSKAKHDLGVRINIGTATHLQLSHSCSLPEGVKWLDDAIEAPEPLLQYLRANCNLHMIAWSSSSCHSPESVLQQDPNDKHRPARFFSGNQFSQVTFSRYGNREKSTTLDPISEARFLTQSTDTSVVAELLTKVAALDVECNQLSTARNELNNRLTPLARTERELNSISGDLGNKEKQRKSWSNTIQSLIRSRDAIMSEVHDPEQEKQTIHEKIAHVNSKRVQTLRQIAYAMKDLNQALEERSSASLAKVHTTELVAVVQKSISQQSAALRQAEEAASKSKEALKLAARKASNQKALAEKEAPLEKYRERFADLPDSIEEIEREEIRLQVQIDAVVGDDSVVSRYKSLEKDIAILTQKQEHYDHRHAEQVAEIDSIKVEWARKLDEITARISSTYKEYFNKFFCDGEVHLIKADDEADWGMSVRVRFRSGDLQQLSQCRQSGGERSVATMLYLLSLQSVTQCPFRVVDEINQGMDAINERNVFNQLVACSTGANTPQIFCITPKLLPNLDFTPAITSLVVCNGAWNLPQPSMDMKKVLDNVKRRRLR